MNQVKNTFISLGLTFLMLLSITVLGLVGYVAYDRISGGAIFTNCEMTITLSKGIPTDELKQEISNALEHKEYNRIKELSDAYAFSYYITYDTGRPVMNKMLGYNEENASYLTYSCGKDNEYIVKLRFEKRVEKSSLVFEYVWRFIYRHIWFMVLMLILWLAILVASLYLLLQYASPVFKVSLVVVLVLALEIAGILLWEDSNPRKWILACSVEKACLLTVLLIYIRHLKRIRSGLSQIGTTEDSYFMKKSSLPISLRPFAQDMEKARANVNNAVNEKMKSERLKTELISNVSHDIKTPLTSVINFSDLIIQEKSENRLINEYATRLHRQSVRLKDLLESLIEASKASVGAVEINLISCNVKTILEQCIVEYEEKLYVRELELVEVPCEEELFIEADAKALSRVFENLLTNICKYALPKSRAYIEAKKVDDMVEISFKNVSKDAIHVSADELVERFVRGDVSRHSDGHGLGLSIVKSLMDLMGGQLEISAEYDMFEVKLVFMSRTVGDAGDGLR